VAFRIGGKKLAKASKYEKAFNGTQRGNQTSGKRVFLSPHISMRQIVTKRK